MGLGQYLDERPEAAQEKLAAGGNAAEPADEIVSATIRGSFDREAAPMPGGEFNVIIKIAIKPGWHIYANPTGVAELNPTTLELHPGSRNLVTMEKPAYPEGVRKVLASSGRRRLLCSRRKSRSGPLASLSKDAKPGSARAQVPTELPGLQRQSLPGASDARGSPGADRSERETRQVREPMSKTITTIGPADHGRPMDLEEFTEAEGQDGRVYELSRGIVTVVEIPKKRHMLQVAAARDQLQLYKSQFPGRIEVIASGNECKLTIPALGSERHPDLAIYLTPPPDEEDGDFWLRWVPEIVIEVVSPSSRKRDYEEKPEEYLRIGVKEYWIVDADILALTVHATIAGSVGRDQGRAAGDSSDVDCFRALRFRSNRFSRQPDWRSR